MDITAQHSRTRWILVGCVSLLIVGTGSYLLRTPGSSWALPFLASVLLSLATSSRRLPLGLAAAGTVIITLSFVIFVRAALPDGSRLDHSLQSLMAISGLWTVAILGLRRKRFEYTLRENEAYSRAILDTAAEGITTIDEEGKLLSFNAAAERIFGYSAAEVLGKSVALFVPPDRHREFEQVLEALANPNTPETAGITQERMALRKDGTVFPMELSISQVVIGKHRIFTGIVRDVTERKRTADTLRESQRALSTLLANLPGMAYRCRNDESWTMLFVSEGCAELTGYKPWDLLGNRKITYAKIIHPEDRGPIWEQVQASLQKRVPFQLTYRIITAQGLEKWVWEQGQGVFAPDGELVALEGFVIDISDRKRAEVALRESEERFRVIADSAPVIIWVDGPDKRCAFFNKTWTDFTGRKGEPGDSDAWSSCVHPDDLQRSLDAYTEVFDHWHPFDCEYRLRRGDGEFRLMHDSGIPRFAPDGQFAGYIGVSIDITDLRRAETLAKERESVLRAILESTDNGILVVDAAGKVAHTNRRFGEMWRIPDEIIETGDDARLLAFVLDQLVSPEAFLGKVQQLYQSSEDDLDTLAFKDGRVFERFSRPLTMDGRVAGRVWNFRDVTERKRAEETIRTERDRARTYLDVAGTMLIAIDTDQRVTLVNRMGCEILGRAEDEIVGQNWFELCIPERARDKTREVFGQIIAGGVAAMEHYENAVVTGSGQERIVEWHNTLLRDEGGHITGTLSSGTDITDRKRTEEALHLTQFSVDRASDAIFWIRPDGRFAYVNEAACRKLGYTREELLSLAVWDIDPLLPREKWEECRDAVRCHGSRSFETAHYTKDGRQFPVEITANFVEFNGREYDCAFARDITERRRTEKLVSIQRDLGLGLSSVSELGRALQMCLKAALEVSEMDGGGIYLVDKTSGTVNLACHDGLPLEFLNKVSHYDPDSANARLVRAGRPVYTSFREAGTAIGLSNGDELRAIACIPVLHENQPIACLNVTSHALYEIPIGARAALEATAAQIGSAIARVRAEEEARASENRYRQLFEDSPLGLLEEDGSAVRAFTDQLRARGETDLRAYFDRHPEALAQCMQAVRIVTINRTALEILGAASREELMASRPALFTGDRVSVWRDAIIAFADGHTLFESEMRATAIGDREKTFALRAALAPGHEQTCGRILVSILDITELVRARQELSHAKRLETAGRIAGQIAHDLNNLLGPLVAYPDLIRGELSPNNHMQPLIDDMESASLQIAEINQDLLALGRRGHYKVQSHNLNTLIETAARQLTVPPDVTFEKRLDDNLSTVRGGGAQLIRVLANLFANALEAMDGHGRLTITTGNVRLDQPPRRYTAINRGEYVRVDVADTGCGIASEIIDRIFEPFFTTKKTDKKRGSGLGLSVVHSILEDHDAYVDVDSIEGAGTTFRLFFPIVPGTADAPFPVEELPRGHGERILVVDDDPMQLRMAHAVLEQLGYHVETATSGEAAVEMVASEPPELVILDMVMPGIDGAETLRRIRDRRPDQRALILSAYADTERVAAAARMGVCDVLAKPIQVRALSLAAHAALQPGLVAAQ